MEYVAGALVIVAVLAWDIARRWLAPRQEQDAARLKQIEENLQNIAADAVVALNETRANAEEIDTTDRALKNLATEWRGMFAQLTASQGKVETDLKQKVGGTIGALLPAKGYNR
jgi:hypothetical protein